MSDSGLFIEDLPQTVTGCPAGRGAGQAEGDDDVTTLLLGEEGDDGEGNPTTLAVGEEGDDGEGNPTTVAVGEEGEGE